VLLYSLETFEVIHKMKVKLPTPLRHLAAADNTRFYLYDEHDIKVFRLNHFHETLAGAYTLPLLSSALALCVGHIWYLQHIRGS